MIVDGRGRLSRLDRLRHHIEHPVVSAHQVDLAAALQHLAGRYGVREVQTDAGGTLNGVLVRAGLVDELSVVVAPQLAGAE